jgi:hypothetical protein
LLATFTEVLAGTWMADTTFTGVFLPLIVILVIMLFSRKEASGWVKVKELTDLESEREHPASSAFPARIVSISLAVAAVTLFGLIPFNTNNQGMLGSFGAGLLILAGLLFVLSQHMQNRDIHDDHK